jgi:hypothetical protein
MTTKSIKNDAMQLMVNGALAEGSKPAKVMDTELVLDTKQKSLLGGSVDAHIKAEDLLFQGSELKLEVATAVSKVMGTNPTYAWWEMVRTTWENVYMSRKQLSNEKSANNAWLDVAKYLKARFELEKPKAPSKDASRMSEKRKAEQAEMQAKPDSVLREEYLAYKADDNLTKATAVKREIERREKQNSAGLIEQRKAKQALLSKAMKKIENDDLLNQLWDLVPQSVKLEIAQSK